MGQVETMSRRHLKAVVARSRHCHLLQEVGLSTLQFFHVMVESISMYKLSVFSNINQIISAWAARMEAVQRRGNAASVARLVCAGCQRDAVPMMRVCMQKKKSAKKLPRPRFAERKEGLRLLHLSNRNVEQQRSREPCRTAMLLHPVGIDMHAAATHRACAPCPPSQVAVAAISAPRFAPPCCLVNARLGAAG